MTDYSRHILEETAKMTRLSDESKAEQLEKFYNMVVKYNENVNLTAITEPEDFLQKHFLDSLALIAESNVSRETFDGKGKRKKVSRETIATGGTQNVSRETLTESENKTATAENENKTGQDNVSRETIVKPGIKIIDIGTGAGFPGIPLAIFRNDLKITLLDSLNKRVSFLENAIKELGLKKCEAIHSRAEDLAHQAKYREAYDICVSRAVAALPVLCEYCLPFVRKGGYFVSYKAAESQEELKSAANAIKVLGGKLHAVQTVTLPDTDIIRKLIIIKKTDNTPKKYPRKAGTPAKSPL